MGKEIDLSRKTITEDKNGNALVTGNIIADNTPSIESEEVIFEVTKEELEAAWNANPTIGGDASTYVLMPIIELTDLNELNYVVYINGKEYIPNYMTKGDRIEIEFYTVNDEENNIFGGYYGSHYDIDWNDSQTTGVLKIDRIDRDQPPVFTSNIKLIKRIISRIDNKYLEDDLKVRRSISFAHNNSSGKNSTAFGSNTEASGTFSHAEGSNTKATNISSHAEGMTTEANGMGAHAEGAGTIAKDTSSHAEGEGTIANCQAQHAQGKYNVEDTENKYAHIVGNGQNLQSRSNAHTLDWDGNAWFQGNVSIDGTPTNDNDLITKEYVDNKLSGLTIIKITQAEYDALEIKDPNTLYLIID